MAMAIAIRMTTVATMMYISRPEVVVVVEACVLDVVVGAADTTTAHSADELP